MSPTLSGVLTVLALLAFLSVTFWAYSSKRKADFDAAARLPLEDDVADGVPAKVSKS
jgi:cytochrome c oxidase cbb3-type subunit IV